jgi:hypothetical protein
MHMILLFILPVFVAFSLVLAFIAIGLTGIVLFLARIIKRLTNKRI